MKQLDQIRRLHINNIRNPMSTNSNEVDELMEETHTKETKLQKFLRVVIDEQTMLLINKYLQENQNPSNQANNKSDRIKLYQDLLIIQKFKVMEKKIGNRKKIDEICQQLKEETNFSTATIRQRIQKKLSNVSKEEIINHIQNEVNFAFDSKRKLVSSKNMKNNISQEDNLRLDDKNVNESKSKQQKRQKIIYVNSSMEESGGSVEQIPRQKPKKNKLSTVQEKQNGKQLRQQPNNPQCYNQFRMDSDHDSDDEILVTKQGQDQYKLSTAKSQTILKELMQKLKQFYLKQKLKPKQVVQPPVQNQQSKNPEVLKVERIEPPVNCERKDNVINLEASDDSYLIENDNRDQQARPPPEELYWYCSVEDWKLANENQQYAHLKWYKDEDDFLIKIVSGGNVEQNMSSLQVLKKFKDSKNIIARMNKLGLTAPNHVMVNLLATQHQ